MSRVWEQLDSKKWETNKDEGLHSFLKDRLACLKRKTKSYVKSARTLSLYLARDLYKKLCNQSNKFSSPNLTFKICLIS